MGRAFIACGALVVVLLGLVALAPGASADDITFCEVAGGDAGQCNGPSALAVDSGTGTVYIADTANNRVDVFKADGSFVLAFGWGVADGSTEALQTCTTSCFKGLSGAGPGELGGPSSIAEDPAGGAIYVFAKLAVQKFTIDDNGTPGDTSDDFAVFERLWGGGVVRGGATGSGDLSAGSATIANVQTSTKRFLVGQTLTGAGIPAGTKILGIGNGTLTLSKPAEASGASVALTAPDGVGNVPGDEVQELAFENKHPSLQSPFKLTFSMPNPSPSSATTAAIPIEATGLQIQEALEALPNIGPGDVSVSGPGGAPGEAGGPWLVTLEGRYADTDVNDLGFEAAANHRVRTLVPGAGGPESCTPANAADCVPPVSGTGPGQFSSNARLANGPGGSVYAGDAFSPLLEGRVQKFDSSGSLLVGPCGTGSAQQAGIWIAVDAVGDFYVGGNGTLRKFDSACNPIGAWGEGGSLSFPNINALTLDGAGNLFVADSSAGPGETAIYELNPAGTPIHTLYGNGTLKRSAIALAPYHDGTGDLFAIEDSNPRRLAHIALEPPGPVVLPFETKASPLGNVTATLKTKVNPEGKPTTVHFQYVDDASFKSEGGFASPHTQTTSESASIGSDFKGHEASFAITCPEPEVELGKKIEEGKCLEAETLYHLRAVATNSDGVRTGETTFETLPPLQLGPAWSTAVGSDSARLHAELNPTGIKAEARFEYVEQEAYEEDIEEGGDGFADAAQTHEIDFGNGTSMLAKSQLIDPLNPGTTYRYRYLAHDFFGDFPSPVHAFATLPPNPPGKSCPNQAFRIGTAASLPDCRAYEMVSPLDKEGGDIVAPGELNLGALGSIRGRLDQATPEGEGLTYDTYRGFGALESVPFSSQYIARRDPKAGWSSNSVNAPREGPSLLHAGGAVTESLLSAFTEDLCSHWLLQDTDLALVPGAPVGVPNLYRRNDCGEEEGQFELLSEVQPPGFGKEAEIQSSYFATLGGFSADGSVSVFKAPAVLTPEARAVPVGEELNCTLSAPLEENGEKVTFKWLSNGATIAGATKTEYTTTAADQGKTIQCQAIAINSGASAGAVQMSEPGQVVAPFPATAPPVAPVVIAAPTSSAPLTVGGGGGQTLSCDPREADWEGSPAFAYQWYRNGGAIGGATSSTYLATAPNLATRADFQCTVTGTNPGGSVARASASLTTDPAPLVNVGGNELAATPQPEPRVLDIYRVYLHDEGGLHLVSVLPNGNAAPAHASVGTALGLPGKRFFDSVAGAVSQDSSRVFWSAQVQKPSEAAHLGSGGAHPSRLYLRINPAQPQSALSAGQCTEAEKACTIQISTGAAIFRGANPEATKALYTEGENLYELDVNKAIAHEAGAATLLAGKVKGLLGESDDTSRVYLVSEEDRDGAGPASAGKFNLYLHEAGGGFAFVARLLSKGWVSEPLSFDGSSADVRSISPFPVNHSSRVSGDGLHATFMSDSLALAEETAGYDNTDAVSGEADSEVYFYSAKEGKLVCVSCNPDGGRPQGRPLREEEGAWAAASIPGWETQWHASRLLSADGSKIFFDSFEGLVSRDTNGKEDVYEWERATSKDECEAQEGGERYAPGSGGCLSLISSGRSPGDAEFIDASGSGSDVFFSTGSSLLPQDYGLVDIYDAREGGGFPTPEAPKPPCEGEACQSPPAAPEDPTPASSAFEGQGNVQASKPKQQKKHKHKRRHKRHHRRAQR